MKQHYSNTSDGDIIRLLERSIREDLSSERVDHYGAEEIRSTLQADEMLFLDVIDALLIFLGEWWAEKKLEGLVFILSHSGSMWTVSKSQPLQLVKRVDETLQEQADRVMTGETKPSTFIRKAWADVFGRSPDASDGYRESIRAVEAAAQPVVLPDSPTATLGTIIAAMRDKPSKWEVALHHPNPESQILNIVGMMEAVWKGQHDRHGSGDESIPLDVSLPEAQAALPIAVTLVQLFQSGAVVRAGGS